MAWKTGAGRAVEQAVPKLMRTIARRGSGGGGGVSSLAGAAATADVALGTSIMAGAALATVGATITDHAHCRAEQGGQLVSELAACCREGGKLQRLHS